MFKILAIFVPPNRGYSHLNKFLGKSHLSRIRKESKDSASDSLRTIFTLKSTLAALRIPPWTIFQLFSDSFVFFFRALSGPKPGRRARETPVRLCQVGGFARTIRMSGNWVALKTLSSEWPRFGSVTVWGWKGSIGSSFRFRRLLYKNGFSVFQYILKERTIPVPVSVPGKRFRRFQFRFRFREKRFWRFRFPVPVRFLSHPVSSLNMDVGPRFACCFSQRQWCFGSS